MDSLVTAAARALKAADRRQASERLHDEARAAGLSVAQEVGPRETAKVTFTPTKPGTYVFYCDKKPLFFPSHREQGMEGRLEVRP